MTYRVLRIASMTQVLFAFFFFSSFSAALAQVSPAPPPSQAFPRPTETDADKFYDYDLEKEVQGIFIAGVEALKAGDYKEAERRFGEVLDYARYHPEANYYMAVAKIGLDKKKAAVIYLRRAISKKNDYVEARETLALLQVELGDNNKAADQLEELKALRDRCNNSCEQSERIDLAILKTEQALSQSS